LWAAQDWRVLEAICWENIANSIMFIVSSCAVIFQTDSGCQSIASQTACA
jgi:hypothetical protein